MLLSAGSDVVFSPQGQDESAHFSELRSTRPRMETRTTGACPAPLHHPCSPSSVPLFKLGLAKFSEFFSRILVLTFQCDILHPSFITGFLFDQ